MDAEAAGVAPVEVAALAEDPLRARVVPLLVVAEADRAEEKIVRNLFDRLAAGFSGG